MGPHGADVRRPVATRGRPNNTKLAEAFNVRLDQVAQRRLELARRAGGSSPPKRRANATRRGDSGDHRLLPGLGSGRAQACPGRRVGASRVPAAPPLRGLTGQPTDPRLPGLARAMSAPQHQHQHQPMATTTATPSSAVGVPPGAGPSPASLRAAGAPSCRATVARRVRSHGLHVRNRVQQRAAAGLREEVIEPGLGAPLREGAARGQPRDVHAGAMSFWHWRPPGSRYVAYHCGPAAPIDAEDMAGNGVAWTGP
jgi:hypothetical protein